MFVRQSIYFIENLVIYLGQIPIQYSHAKGGYVPIKCPFWMLLKIFIFYTILFLIYLVKQHELIQYKNPEVKKYETIQNFTVNFVKLYRVTHDLVQLLEMMWNQSKFKRTMNKLLSFSNLIGVSNNNNIKKKIEHYVFLSLFGLILMEILVVYLVIWSLNLKTDIYVWFSTLYYNGQIAIEFIQCLYFICVFKVLQGTLESLIDFLEQNPTENLYICIENHRNSRKILRKLMDVHAFQIILHLFSMVLLYGCSIYIGFAAVIEYNQARLNFSFYMLASTSVLVITPVLCFNISDTQDQVRVLHDNLLNLNSKQIRFVCRFKRQSAKWLKSMIKMTVNP